MVRSLRVLWGILCRSGPVLEGLRPGGTVPQVNPKTPPRRQREPSPSTPGDNKRQSLRLKAGQQALAGLTLGSRPVSASDNPEVRTPTKPAGRKVELQGETLPFQPWARHCMEISDRPTTLPITHDPNLSDKVMYLQMAFKQRPLRDGGGKPSLQRWGPRSLSSRRHGGTNSRSRSLGDGSHPFPEDLLEDIREILAPGAGRLAEGQPFFLDILHSLALNIQDPDHQFPRDLEQGVTATQEAERGGAGVPRTPLSGSLQ